MERNGIKMTYMFETLEIANKYDFEVFDKNEIVKIINYAINGADNAQDYTIGDRLYNFLGKYKEFCGMNEEE